MTARRGLRVARTVAVGALATLLTGCLTVVPLIDEPPPSDSIATPSTADPTPTSQEQAYPVSVDEWSPTTSPDDEPTDVDLDPAGRPFEGLTLPRVQVQDVGTLTSPSGRVGLVDGNLGCCQWGWQLDGSGELRVQLIREFDRVPSPTPATTRTVTPSTPTTLPDTRPNQGTIAGALISLPGRTVTRWGAYRDGYGTDGGVGAFHTQELANPHSGPEGEFDRAISNVEDDYTLADVDGVPGNDLLVFSNGLGDGGFPLIVGYDRDGKAVALLSWSGSVAWRIAFPDAAPPPNVSAAERHLADCLAAGGRPSMNGCRLG